MVCASQKDAFIAAEALGLTETHKPKGQVVEMVYQPGESKMAFCYVIERRLSPSEKWTAIGVTMGETRAETLAASYGVNENKEPQGRVVALPLM